MEKVSKTVSLVIISVFALSFLALMGCTKHPSAEQLQALEEQRQATIAAEQQVEAKKREKTRLESE
jgi:sensor domain CHASE-containing protein